jgi:protease-4
MDENARKVTESMIAEGFQWFRGLVESRRGVKTADIGGLDQGRIFSGREAVNLKLADEIGGEAEAVHWLEEKKGLKHGLKVVDWKPRHGSDWTGLTSSSSGIGGWALRELASALAETIGNAREAAGLSLDGLVSVWHPSEN